MVILVHETILERGFFEGCRRETGHRCRLVAGQCQIVQTQVLATGLGDGHRILALFQILEPIGPCTGCGLCIGVERHRDIQLVDHGVVYSHRSLEATVITQHHGQRTARAVAGQGIGLWGTRLIEGFVVEVPATVIPGEVVYLIERVIVVVRGIIGLSESRTVECQWLCIVFRQQIAAIIGIRIACAREGILVCPGHRPHTIEKPSAADGDGWHLLQVVGLCQIITRQLLRLQCSAIAVYLHFRRVGESRLLHQRLCQLINPALRNTDFRPTALS